MAELTDTAIDAALERGRAAFMAQAHRQSQAVATSSHAGEDQAFIDAASDCGVE